jgi:anaerobic nitric oxide reductase transcription regulator
VLSASAQEALRRYHWLGNVRELRNTIAHAAIEARSYEISVADLALPEPQTEELPAANGGIRRSQLMIQL